MPNSQGNSFDSRKYRLSFSFETREQLWRFYDSIRDGVIEFDEIPVNFFKVSKVRTSLLKK